ncbi:hypothetical protein HCH54_007576 [Aspergillus fumigatus]
MAPSIWEKAKVGGKKGFDKAWNTVDKLGAPVNRLSNRVGAEAFWPMTLDKESDKAARILRSFCKDGFYTKEDLEQNGTDSDGKINRPKAACFWLVFLKQANGVHPPVSCCTRLESVSWPVWTSMIAWLLSTPSRHWKHSRRCGVLWEERSARRLVPMEWEVSWSRRFTSDRHPSGHI